METRICLSLCCCLASVAGVEATDSGLLATKFGLMVTRACRQRGRKALCAGEDSSPSGYVAMALASSAQSGCR